MAKHNHKIVETAPVIETAPIVETAPVKTVAELMADVKVKMVEPRSIVSVTGDLNEYLTCYAPELKQRVRELSGISKRAGVGGMILDETIFRFYTITGKGVTKTDMMAILLKSEVKRRDVNGYCGTFTNSENELSKAGCPDRAKRFKKDGLYCVTMA